MRYQRLFQRELWVADNTVGDDQEKQADDDDSIDTPNGQRPAFLRRSSLASSFWTSLGYVIALLLAIQLVYQKRHRSDVLRLDDGPHLKCK